MSKHITKAIMAKHINELNHQVAQLKTLLEIRDDEIAKLRCQHKIDTVRIDVVKASSKLDALKPKFLELQRQGKKPVIKRDLRTGELAVFIHN